MSPRLRGAERIVLLLDYDGTLRPIARRPQDAGAGPRLLGLLRRLEKIRGLTSVIVTGRTITSIRGLLPLRNTWFVGVHGAEICRGFGKSRWLVDTGETRTAIRHVVRALRPHMDSGYTLEDKRVAVSMHYRLAPPESIQRMCALFRRLGAPHVEKGLFKFNSGKGVIETIPAKAHKGLAVDAFCLKQSRRKIFCMAFGDDETDEDLFRSVKSRGIAVAVGRRPSRAEHRFHDPADVCRFLNLLGRAWIKSSKISGRRDDQDTMEEVLIRA